MDSGTISVQEKNFIVDGVEEGVRNDGRGLFDYRQIHVEGGVLPLANGSARVRIGNATDVLVSVKAELTAVDSVKEWMPNRLNFFVDFSAVASPHFAGRGGNDLAEELAGIFYSAYDNDEVLPDLNGKCILSPFHLWSIYVDAVVVKYGGNVLDAISLGVKAALADMQICEVVTIPADAERVTIDMPDEITMWRFDISRAPLVVSVNKIGTREVFDADEMEEASSTARLLVGVAPPHPRQDDRIPDTQDDGDEKMDVGEEQPQSSQQERQESRITCVQKLGGGSLEFQSLQSMIELAMQVATNMDRALMQWLNEEAKTAGRDGWDPLEPSRTFLK